MVFIHLPRHDLTTRAKDLYNDAHDGRPNNILSSDRNGYLGAIINQPLTVHRETALHVAVIQNNERTVENLLLIGADPNAQDAGQETPFLASTRMNTTSTSRNLIVNGGNPNVPDVLGITPLHWIARHGTLDLMVDALAAGGSVTTKTNRDETALHWATYNPDPRMAQLLVQVGANPGDKMIDGNDAAACARARMRPELANWLDHAVPGQKTPNLPEITPLPDISANLQKWRQSTKPDARLTPHRMV